jgi:hypothetical protein
LSKQERRKPGVPKYYYWAKDPKNILRHQALKAGLLKAPGEQANFENPAQKKFFRVIVAFKVAKLVAAAAFLLILLYVVG